MANVAGILLAAGAGRRMGRPKALMRAVDGTPWLTAAGRALHDGGCSPVVVVLGAAAEEARALLNGLDVQALEAGDWATGMGASLRTGLASLAEGVGRPDRDGYGDDPALITADAALIHLVDLPDVGPDVVSRVLGRAGSSPAALARAAYQGVPGHPVLLGREHWDPVTRSAGGDQGARSYLRTHRPLLVECGDLAAGADVDRPPAR